MSNAVDVTAGDPVRVPSLRVVPSAVGSRTVTSSLHGLIRNDARSRAEFLDVSGIRS